MYLDSNSVLPRPPFPCLTEPWSSSRGLSVGIYTTNTAEATKYVAEMAQCNIIVVENDQHLQKVCILHIIPAYFSFYLSVIYFFFF